jgi:hypothetical protein
MDGREGWRGEGCTIRRAKGMRFHADVQGGDDDAS